MCRSGATQLLEALDAQVLANAYRNQLGVHMDLPERSLDYLLCTQCDLRFFWPPIAGSEQFYAQLQKISWYYSAAKQEFGIAAAYVKPDYDVLEIGAGRGLFSRAIQCRSYTGLEFSPDAIRWAAEDGIQLLPRTVEEHARTAGGAYDVACAFQVLEHVTDPRSFLEAAARCVKSGGRLIMSVPGEDSFARYAYGDVLNMPPHHLTRWSDRSLRSISEILGWRLIAIVPEPLGRNMRRAYADACAQEAVGKAFGQQLHLLDSRRQRLMFCSLQRICAAAIRFAVSAQPSKPRRGHAVIAIFEKLH
jgi:2-polyprenyl-3-methyl-5-hydroxy-6-metoxy-1,4-benzoquinol methylase